MLLKNPKVEIKGSNLFNHIKSENFNGHLEIAFGDQNPNFECTKHLNGSLTLNNVFIKRPICEFPKFGFFKTYFSFETSRVELLITAENSEDLDEMNKLYKTNYYFNGDKQRKKIYGLCEFQNPENKKNGWRSLNWIKINNSSKEYIDFIYEQLAHKNANVCLTMVLQPIQEWNAIPIIDMYFTKQTGTSDWNEIIKDANFKSLYELEGEYPRKYNKVVR